MARIGIDARKYFDYGIGTYLQHLIEEIQVVDPGQEVMLYVAPTDDERINVPGTWKKRNVSFAKYSLSELFRFSSRVRRDALDLFHEPHYTLPYNLSVPAVVVTIHDLIHLRLRQYFTPLQRTYAKFVMGHAVSRADAILTSTEFTRREMMEQYPASEKKIHVIPLAVAEKYRRGADPERVRAFKSKSGIVKPYLLYAGSLKPHKNIPVLLHAFARSKCRQDVDVVFVGEKISRHRELSLLLEHLKLSRSVYDLGNLSSDELLAAFASAQCVVVPSEYEGFGLPALEAMACGTPVIISDAGALVEVAGGAALVTERNNIEDLSSAIDRVCSDNLLRNEMSRKGIERSQQFSWREMARKTLQIYHLLS